MKVNVPSVDWKVFVWPFSSERVTATSVTGILVRTSTTVPLSSMRGRRVVDVAVLAVAGCGVCTGAACGIGAAGEGVGMVVSVMAGMW